MTYYPGFWFDVLLKRSQRSQSSKRHRCLARFFSILPITLLPCENIYHQADILENQLRAIDMQRCTYVPLGNSNSQTKFRSSLILRLATRGPKQKTKNWYNSWTNGWIISKDKDTQVFDLTYFSRSQRLKFKTYCKVGLFCYYLT
jgi:hypothetical protein